MGSAFIPKKISLSRAILGLGLALMLLPLTTSIALAKISPLPLDGVKVIVKETKILDSYSTSANYEYAKGETYDRWVYSPWVIKGFSATEQRIENPAQAVKRSMLTGDLTVPLSNLKAGQKYTLDVKALFGCLSVAEKPEGNVCSVDLAVNCYGYVDGKWARTFKASKTLDTNKDGELLIGNIEIDPAKCSSAMHINLRGGLTSEAKSFAIKQLELSMKEAAKAPTPVK